MISVGCLRGTLRLGHLRAGRGPGGSQVSVHHQFQGAIRGARQAFGMNLGPEKLRLICYGQPKGAGSKTAEPLGKRGAEVRDREGRIVLKYRHATLGTKDWMDAVAKEARIAWRGLGPLSGALWLDLTCYEDRPASHYRGGSERLLRPEAPAYPHRTRTHDSGKLRRAIEDSLTEVVWEDDKRVIDGHDRKRYCDNGDEPRAVIRVGVMVAQTVADLGIPSPAPVGQEQLLAA